MSTTDMSIFDTFIAAKQALDELPAVKAELVKVNNDLALERDMITIADEEAIKAKEEIAKLKSALSVKEAELASATFRAKQSADMLDNLRGLLGVQSTPVGDHTSPLADEAGSKIDWSKSEPMPEEEPYWHSKIKAMPNEVEVPQDSASMLLKPEHLPGPLPGPDSPATTYGVVDETGRFVSHDPEPEVARYPEALPSDSEPQPDPKPYDGRPYWQKPSTITWGEWNTKGGLTPWGYNKEFDEYKYA